MEATIENCLSKNDKALVVNGGSFGHRFCQLLEWHKIPFDSIDLKWNEQLTENQEMVMVEVDFIEIKRTINNLLTNANQYSPHNTTITITLKETTTNFIIEITNQTILTEKQYYFTNPLDQHIETKSVNTGLGLYICKQIIELHNGKIEQKIAKNQNKIQLFLPKIKQHLTSQK